MLEAYTVDRGGFKLGGDPLLAVRQDEVFADREPPYLILSPRSPATPLAGLTHIRLPAR